MGIVKESEKVIEKNLCKEVKLLGGQALKIPASQFAGIPDRLCLIPFGRVYFVEVKSTGVKPTKIQLHVHAILRKLGFIVEIIDSSEKLKAFIDFIKLD